MYKSIQSQNMVNKVAENIGIARSTSSIYTRFTTVSKLFRIDARAEKNADRVLLISLHDKAG